MLFEKQILNNIDKWIPLIIPHIVEYMKKHLVQKLETSYNITTMTSVTRLVTYINDIKVTEVVIS